VRRGGGELILSGQVVCSWAGNLEVEKEKNQQKKKKKPQRQGQHQKGQQTSTHIQPQDEKSRPIQWTEFPTGALVGAGSCWRRVQTLTRAVVCGRKSVEVICGSCSVGIAHGIWRPGGNVTSSSSSPELAKKLKDQCQQTHTWTTYKFPAENAK